MDQRIRVASYVVVAAIAGYIFLPVFSRTPSKKLSKYATGLVNSGNFCYANSVFQALASLATLETWLLSSLSEQGDEIDKENHKNEETEENASNHCYNSKLEPPKPKAHWNDNKPWTSTLLEVLRTIKEEHTYRRSTSIWPLIQVMESQMHGHLSRAQQDAHEMLVYVLDLLEREISMGAFLQESLPYGTTIEDRIVCHNCGLISSKSQRTSILERQPGESIVGPQSEQIYDYHCSKCGPTHITKTSQITRLSSILIVHINRSTADGQRNNMSTLIPLTFGAFTMQAVVFHHGMHSRGHYTCARRKCKPVNSKTWWVISDDVVSEASDRDIMSRTQDAYLLFFERQTSNSSATMKDSKCVLRNSIQRLTTAD